MTKVKECISPNITNYRVEHLTCPKCKYTMNVPVMDNILEGTKTILHPTEDIQLILNSLKKSLDECHFIIDSQSKQTTVLHKRIATFSRLMDKYGDVTVVELVQRINKGEFDDD